MMALPSPCAGVMTWPSSSALNTIAVSGSRFMISAVRNGPILIVETTMKKTAAVLAMLITTSAGQPKLVCGAFQVWVAADATRNTSVDDISEYQVTILASAPTR